MTRKRVLVAAVSDLPKEVGGVVFEIENGVAGQVRPITFQVPARPAHVARV